MVYKQKNLALHHPLAFWKAFEGSERVFWYDTQQNLLIIASERQCVLQNETELPHYPYVFASFTFFEKTQGKLWQNFGNEILAFKHYFIQTPTSQTYYFLDEAREIKDVPVIKYHHKLIEAPEDLTAWKKLFAEIQESIHTKKVKKVVASRQVNFESAHSFHIDSILQNLTWNNPKCVIFAYQKDKRTFLGATPEILVQKSGKEIRSIALAGTISKNISNAAQTLLTDQKNRCEHQIVIDKIQKKMKENGDAVTVGATHILDLKNVFHLQTVIRAKTGEQSLLDWVKILHPTPALGGEPSDLALQLLRKNEGYERGLYAAPIGMIDANGDGTFVVGIRSALLSGHQLHAFAGGGIVADSELEDELNETKIKLKTILEAL